MKKLLLNLFVVTALLFASVSIFAKPIPKINVNAFMQNIISQTHNLRPQVLKTALKAYKHAWQNGLHYKKRYLTVIDYSMPSSKKRMWVIDLKKQKVLFHTLVAHGKNNGVNYATHFSNRPQSLESSIGLYLTKNTYEGHDGYSLILDGLDKGFNNNAERRHIIMHGAWYVGQDIINEHGRIGRSWGCPALSKKVATPIIHTIKNGTLVMAYYPNKNWLDHSVYLS